MDKNSMALRGTEVVSALEEYMTIAKRNEKDKQIQTLRPLTQGILIKTELNHSR